ncbi:MAG TPA: SDR family NAD(P)-dependent oxidoreductase, partial [Nitrospirota bacterium]|nr:SDR family NAD(P)-dependent oxidoreductase [Nitrospirota bacterium]
MGNRIVITGASSLIGQAIARKLTGKGDHVLLHCFRNSAACRALAETSESNCEIIVADFTKREDIDAF